MRYVPRTLTGKILVSVLVIGVIGVGVGFAWVKSHTRWSIKTGTDADAGLVDLEKPVTIDVAGLRALDRPARIPRKRRATPVETTVYVVPATLVKYKRMHDGDYHVVIAGEDGSTMITEIPDPARVGASCPFRDRIVKARADFDARYNATMTWQSPNVPVVVTGVGFFDFPHGQIGAAPNQIELHPVLDIQFP